MQIFKRIENQYSIPEPRNFWWTSFRYVWTVCPVSDVELLIIFCHTCYLGDEGIRFKGSRLRLVHWHPENNCCAYVGSASRRGQSSTAGSNNSVTSVVKPRWTGRTGSAAASPTTVVIVTWHHAGQGVIRRRHIYYNPRARLPGFSENEFLNFTWNL